MDGLRDAESTKGAYPWFTVNSRRKQHAARPVADLAIDPIDYRYLPARQKFSKYQWIKVQLAARGQIADFH
jgi:hypothetical protein